MTILNVSNQQLRALDVSKKINLTTFDCVSNKLTELDVSKNINLTTLCCFDNELTELDLSKNLNLKTLFCENNPDLKQILIRKGQKITIYKDDHTQIIEVEEENKMTLDELKRSLKLYRSLGLVQAAIDCQEFDHKKEGLFAVLKEIESLLTEYLQEDGSF
jgi:hypothetical protein